MFKIILNGLGFFLATVGYFGFALPTLINAHSDPLVILGWVSIIPAIFLLRDWLYKLFELIFTDSIMRCKNDKNSNR